MTTEQKAAAFDLLASFDDQWCNTVEHHYTCPLKASPALGASCVMLQ